MKPSVRFVMKIPWDLVRVKSWTLLYFVVVFLSLISEYSVTLQNISSSNNALKENNGVKSPAVIYKESIDDDSYKRLAPNCPSLDRKIYTGHAPRAFLDGQLTSPNVNYTKVSKNVTKLDECINECCSDSNSGCQSIFAFSNDTTGALSCFMVSCKEGPYCLPSKSTNNLVNSTAVVLLRPPEGYKSWSDVFNEAKAGKNPVTCEVGLDRDSCQTNEECVPMNSRSRNGICKCLSGFVRNSEDHCISEVVGDGLRNPTEAPLVPSEPAKITVQVNPKNITLPTNTATLTAFPLPDAPPGSPYSYEWTLIDDGKTKTGTQNAGQMFNSNQQQLKLSKLEEGRYEFKVTVTGSVPAPAGSKGEAIGVVTVLSVPKINQRPHAIVVPLTQTITLPTKTAIIDGSSSTDDEDVSKLSYKWELRQGPLAYETPIKSTEATLTLDDLVAGNYTIRLTVTDANSVSDYVDAFLQVTEERDYPPIANAGEDIIIHLPQNELTLHGNQSSDDHGIVSWEWTRSGDSAKLAGDMTNTRTAHLHLANLEEGVYTFALKVTDVKGQSQQATVNVYVKPPSNQAPTSNAGSDQEISLPLNWIILDGSKSKDDQGIIKYTWTQVNGPNDALIIPPLNQTLGKANATGLTKGEYVFSLTVEDAAKNANTDEVKVQVKQDKNQAPVANAGQPREVQLPQSVVILDGSGSTDDLKIATWKWTRLPNSLAAGKIVGDSASKPSLLLVELVPGEYFFELEVWDDQGKSGKHSTSLTVKDNPNRMNIVEVVLNEPIHILTQTRIDSLKQSIGLLLRSLAKGKTDENVESPIHIHILDISPQRHSSYAVVQFLVEEHQKDGAKEIMNGTKVVNELNSKLTQGKDILDLKLLELDTLVCQNDCSGHGKCDQATRECLCEPFWIENVVRRHLMDGKRNCDWSVIYVGIIFSVVSCVMVCCAVYFLCKRRRGIIKLGLHKGRDGHTKSRSKRRYTRLEQHDPGMELRNAHTSSLMKSSESDSESDEIMFENHIPNEGYRGPRPRKNGASRTGRGGSTTLGLLGGSGGSSADGSSEVAVPLSSSQANIAIRRGNGYAKFNAEDKA